MQKKLSRGNHRAPSNKATVVTYIDTLVMSYTDVAPQPSALSPAEIKALIH